jgi:predicted dinucleotide-binding enzyme
MNIGIIGAGNVGGNLGTLLAAKGHEVKYGVRDVQKINALLAQERVSAGSIGDAVSFGEVVILAARPDGLQEIVAQGGDWSGKVVIDAMNRFTPPPPDSTGSLGEDVARLIPGAKVAKAFNTIGAEQYGRPQFGAQAASMYICSDDEQAKSVAAILAEELGFEVVDCGPLSNAALLESLAKLWVYLARHMTGREVAFMLLRR